MSAGVEWMSCPAIDIHGHVGALPDGALPDHAVSGDGSTVAGWADRCAIALTCVSHLAAFAPDGSQPDVASANTAVVRVVESTARLRFYAVLNPRDADWRDHIDGLLDHPKCVGVKLHPRWNHWGLDEYGREVFGFLNERRCLVLAHTGNAGCEAERFVAPANNSPNVRLIVAHLGHDMVNGAYDAQINAVQAARHDNIWTDTSSSRSLTPGLLEYAVQRIGSTRILFGTDTPLYFPASQKARVAYAHIGDDKRNILGENARALPGMGEPDIVAAPVFPHTVAVPAAARAHPRHAETDTPTS